MENYLKKKNIFKHQKYLSACFFPKLIIQFFFDKILLLSCLLNEQNGRTINQFIIYHILNCLWRFKKKTIVDIDNIIFHLACHLFVYLLTL